MGALTKLLFGFLAVLSMATIAISKPSYSTAQFRSPRYRPCSTDKYTCSYTRDCIPGNRRCDHQIDCLYGDDEQNCVCDRARGEFQCLNNKCISGRMRCNGYYDCPNGEDELHCGCARDKFQCVVDGRCVLSVWICDGFNDCTDGSDEQHCLTSTTSPTQVKDQNSLIANRQTSGGEFLQDVLQAFLARENAPQ